MRMGPGLAHPFKMVLRHLVARFVERCSFANLPVVGDEALCFTIHVLVGRARLHTKPEAIHNVDVED